MDTKSYGFDIFSGKYQRKIIDTATGKTPNRLCNNALFQPMKKIIKACLNDGRHTLPVFKQTNEIKNVSLRL